MNDAKSPKTLFFARVNVSDHEVIRHTHVGWNMIPSDYGSSSRCNSTPIPITQKLNSQWPLLTY